MTLLNGILRQCEGCKTYKLWFLVHPRTVKIPQINIVTASKASICKPCAQDVQKALDRGGIINDEK